MKAVWPDAFVEEANLSQNISVLRKALGDTPEDRRYIVTLPGKGYRLAVEVRMVMQDGEDLVVESRSRSKMIIEQTESSSGQNLYSFRSGLYLIAAAAILLVAIAALFAYRFFLHRPILTAKDTVVLADFANSTGDSVFDETLRQGYGGATGPVSFPKPHLRTTDAAHASPDGPLGGSATHA